MEMSAFCVEMTAACVEMSAFCVEVMMCNVWKCQQFVR